QRTHTRLNHGDHTVKITCAHTGKLLRQLEGHPRTPWTVKYHPTNYRIVASGCLGCQVRVWDWNFQTERYGRNGGRVWNVNGGDDISLVVVVLVVVVVVVVVGMIGKLLGIWVEVGLLVVQGVLLISIGREVLVGLRMNEWIVQMLLRLIRRLRQQQQYLALVHGKYNTDNTPRRLQHLKME
ncbi:WD40 repeat domain-containing protein, partial [Skeletonema marinoi]